MGHPSEQAIHVAAKYDLQTGETAFFCRCCNWDHNWDRKIKGLPANQCPNCGARGLSFVSKRGEKPSVEAAKKS